MTTVLAGVDTGVRDLAGVDLVVHRIDEVLLRAGHVAPTAYVASTHFVSSGGHHHAVAVGWEATDVDADGLLAALTAGFPEGAVLVDDGALRTSGPAEQLAGGAEAVRRHRTRESGRLARFPGQDVIQRRLTVAEVTTGSCVDEVVGLAGTEIVPSTEVDLTGFVRPTWRDGRCLVLVQPSVDGLVPFEARHQIACCADH